MIGNLKLGAVWLWVVAVLLCLSASAYAEDGDWLEIETSHFRVASNASLERAVEVARDLERFRLVLGRLSPQLELEPVAPTRVVAFRDGESFAPFRSVPGDAGKQIQGQFLSRPEASYLTLNAGVSGLAPYEVIYHEYVHDVLRRNLPQIPLWFEEGLAEYYSSFAIANGTVLLGRPIARHIGWWQESGGSVREVLDAVVERSEHGQGRAPAQPFYSVSWALVHYLFSGGEERSEQIANYLALLIEGEDPERAFREAFSTSVDELDEILARHVLRPDLPVARVPLPPNVGAAVRDVRRLNPSEVHLLHGELQIALGRWSAAEQLFSQAVAGAPEWAAGHAGVAAAFDGEGRLEEAGLLYRDALDRGALDRDALDRGSADAVVHLRFARNRLLLAQSTTVATDVERRARLGLCREAESLLKRAIELFPRYAEAYALLGAVHLLGDLDAARGVAAITRALELTPDRPGWIVNQIQLLLRLRELDRARRVLQRDLRRVADSDLFERTRDEVDRIALIDASEEAFGAGDFEEGLLLYDQAITLTRDELLRERMEVELHRLKEQFESRRAER